MLLQHNIIWLKEGHVIPTVEQLAQKNYCKWHNSLSHTTNECNYFHQKIQSALSNDRLTLGDAQQMKLDLVPFSVAMINFEENRVLVRTDQAESTKGKKVLVSDELNTQLVKPRNP
jgi:hypothetical protein